MTPHAWGLSLFSWTLPRWCRKKYTYRPILKPRRCAKYRNNCTIFGVNQPLLLMAGIYRLVFNMMWSLHVIAWFWHASFPFLKMVFILLSVCLSIHLPVPPSKFHTLPVPLFYSLHAIQCTSHFNSKYSTRCNYPPCVYALSPMICPIVLSSLCLSYYHFIFCPLVRAGI